MVIITNLDFISERITARHEAAVSLRSMVECGGTGNLNAYINLLDALNNMVTNFELHYNQTEENFTEVVDTFVPEVYNKIILNSQISQGVRDFVESYETFENSTQSLINTVN